VILLLRAVLWAKTAMITAFQIAQKQAQTGGTMNWSGKAPVACGKIMNATCATPT
jgi:hypothetical protein